MPYGLSFPHRESEHIGAQNSDVQSVGFSFQHFDFSILKFHIHSIIQLLNLIRPAAAAYRHNALA